MGSVNTWYSSLSLTERLLWAAVFFIATGFILYCWTAIDWTFSDNGPGTTILHVKKQSMHFPPLLLCTRQPFNSKYIRQDPIFNNRFDKYAEKLISFSSAVKIQDLAGNEIEKLEKLYSTCFNKTQERETEVNCFLPGDHFLKCIQIIKNVTSGAEILDVSSFCQNSSTLITGFLNPCTVIFPSEQKIPSDLGALKIELELQKEQLTVSPAEFSGFEIYVGDLTVEAPFLPKITLKNNQAASLKLEIIEYISSVSSKDFEENRQALFKIETLKNCLYQSIKDECNCVLPFICTKPDDAISIPLCTVNDYKNCTASLGTNTLEIINHFDQFQMPCLMKESTVNDIQFNCIATRLPDIDTQTLRYRATFSIYYDHFDYFQIKEAQLDSIKIFILYGIPLAVVTALLLITVTILKYNMVKRVGKRPYSDDYLETSETSMYIMPTRKSILVTGAGGFIGSHVVLELLENNYNVIAIDTFDNCVRGERYPVSLERVMELTGKRFRFYDADVLSKETLLEIFEQHRIDSVMHFAGLKAVGESISKPLEYYWTNVGGALTLLRAMKEEHINNLIFSSSATVYGPPKQLPINEEQEIGCGLTNPYGRSKFFIEQILEDFHAANTEWNIISLRYFNPVGAHPSGLIGEDPTSMPNNLMPNISKAAAGKIPALRIFGNDYDTVDGTGVRDYIHVVDLAKGHVAALQKLHENAGYKVYNLGNGKGYSVLQLVEEFERSCGRKIPYVIENRRPGDLAEIYCDNTLARNELNWTPKYDLQQMCVDTWNWQQKNPDGYVSSEMESE
ncbi:UDP-glucose 4-epimerase [Trichinella nativa]|uniref:UDP-N-acetylglucosamine 4-epimerase n=2 Tax=Trichinella nativa TaxID=6335 RepID=A0A0V1LE19_9BILA|nr:UDP-glucose 4-epimerase [Trichinella nativa]